MHTLFIILALILISGCAFFGQPQFTSPGEKTYRSPQYQNGAFHNPTETPVMTSNKSQFEIFKDFLFSQDVEATPVRPIPSEKTNLFDLVAKGNGLVWMGHSSYFLVSDGKTFLIDPVLSKNASPVPHTNVAFSGTNIYQAEDIPPVDFLLITHDHWDHLDYPTLSAVKDKIQRIVVPLGVGSYLEKWGFDKGIISEGDWFDNFIFNNDVTVHILPARHFSGRMLTKNQTLWASFAVRSGDTTFYFGGDSGYGSHFKAIQKTLGVIDYAILECGQYNTDWANIHMFPEQTAQAGEDLNARYVIPSHNSKFKLSHHSWYEPLERVTKASEDKHFQLLTPQIGETISFSQNENKFYAWWEEYKQPETVLASN